MQKQLPRVTSSETPFASDGDLSQVYSKITAVRRRLRLQAALRGFLHGLACMSAVLLVALVGFRVGVLSHSSLFRLCCFSPVVVGLFVGAHALRRIDPLSVAAQIDQSHALHNRLSSALQFAQGQAHLPKTEVTQGLVSLAIRDAAQVAVAVKPALAAPWQRPKILPFLCVLLALNGVFLVVRFEFRRAKHEIQKKLQTETATSALRIDKELLAPEKEDLLQKIAEAEQRGDRETVETLRKMLDLLEQVERGEITRQQAFDRLSELEQRLNEKESAALVEMERRMRQVGSELAETKLAQGLGQALVKQDFDRAKTELKNLADNALKNASTKEKQQMAEAFERAARAMAGQKEVEKESEKAKAQDEWKAQSKAEELSRKSNELREERQKLEKQIEKNPNDTEAQQKLAELKKQEEKLAEEIQKEQERIKQETERQKEEQAARDKKLKDIQKQREELQEEERRLRKKLADNPNQNDEETERRLKQTKRQLEQLEQLEQQEQQEQQLQKERQLERLENSSPEYHDEVRKLMSDMEREQQKFEDEIRKLQREKSRLEEEIRSLQEKLKKNPKDKQAQEELAQKQKRLEQVKRELQEKQQAQQQMKEMQRDLQQAAERMRKSLEKMTPEQRQSMEQLAKDISRYQDEVRKLAKQKQGQKQTIVTLDQIKQVLRRLGKGPSAQGKKDLEDFKKRANGESGGQTLTLGGDGQDGQSTLVLMPGSTSNGGQGQGQGQGTPQGPGKGDPSSPSNSKPGTQHDPNFLGDVTQIESKRHLTRVYGKEGTGPTRSQTIQGAAEKGFATASYRKVYGDYTAVSEEIMSKQRVPPGYRFYVKRYFQMIKPRSR
ncbi:MAG TPA: hypothetical protein PKE31_10820 [Pseudomonadota bacterium]|nr:hypothetical protein [Pseudomonadota bacterium]